MINRQKTSRVKNAQTKYYKQNFSKAIIEYAVWWPFSAGVGPVIKCVLYIQ